MKTSLAPWLFVFAAGLPLAAEAADPCGGRSAPRRATLIELFTSEGCNSCPPADRWLSTMARGAASSDVVTLAFHVDYWDSLGWRDRFASPAYTARQEARRVANRGGFVYTPQVTVDGRDTPSWQRAASPRELAAAARAPGADLRLAVSGSPGRYAVRLDAELKPAAGITRDEAVAFLALTENGLSSAVAAGENRGRRLGHDFVVREWRGPFRFGPDGRLAATQEIVRKDFDARRSALVVVAESADGRQLLQALTVPFCVEGR